MKCVTVEYYALGSLKKGLSSYGTHKTRGGFMGRAKGLLVPIKLKYKVIILQIINILKE